MFDHQLTAREIHDAGGKVLAPRSHQRLHLASTQRDLINGCELDQVSANAEDPLVPGRITRRVAQLETAGSSLLDTSWRPICLSSRGQGSRPGPTKAVT
jgi:hypothetical protein